MPIAEEKYVSLTTFRKDGTPASTPVWIAGLGDGTVGCTTASTSFKVERIGNDPKVTLRPCNSRGSVTEGSDVVAGTAEVVTGADAEHCRSMVRKKYGLQFAGITLFGKVAKLFGKGSGVDCAVKITLT